MYVCNSVYMWVCIWRIKWNPSQKKVYLKNWNWNWNCGEREMMMGKRDLGRVRVVLPFNTEMERKVSLKCSAFSNGPSRYFPIDSFLRFPFPIGKYMLILPFKIFSYYFCRFHFFYWKIFYVFLILSFALLFSSPIWKYLVFSNFVLYYYSIQKNMLLMRFEYETSILKIGSFAYFILFHFKLYIYVHKNNACLRIACVSIASFKKLLGH